jgi:hypothetical protein
MFSYLPMEVVGASGDDELLARWRGNPPDVAVWVGVPLTEFGSSGFGKDYAEKSMAWFLAEYAPVTDPNEAIVLLVRKQKLRRDAALRGLALPRAETGPGRTISGRVDELFDHGDGTFLHLTSGDEKVWVGVTRAKVAIGANVTVFDASLGAMEDRGLRRRFERLFVGRLDPPVVTVARLRAQKESFRDKDVAIRGTVVEALPSTGRINRVRIRDAFAPHGLGSDEIVVLTLERLKVGEVVQVRGRVSIDRDFGAGFADAFVLEGWHVTR